MAMLHRAAWLLLAISTLASLVAVKARWQAEAFNRRVGIVLDAEQLLEISADSGVALPQILPQMKEAGATAVALNEQTVEDLFRTGQLTWELYPKFPSPIVRASSVQVVERLQRSLTVKTPLWRTVYTPSRQKLLDTLRAGQGVLVYAYTDTGGVVGLSAPTASAQFHLLSLGIDPLLAKQVRQAGLEVVARVNNTPACTPERVKHVLAQAERSGAKLIIFGREEVLGFRALVPLTAEEMRKLGMLYGSVEFGKQRGDTTLSRLLVDRMVRVHSVTAAEMSTLSPGDAIERYTRAVRERNIRVCYVRLPSVLDKDPLYGARRFVYQLRRSLQESSYQTDEPHPFTDPAVPAWVWWMAGGSSLAAGVLLLERLLGLRSLGWLALLAFAAGMGATHLGGETGRKLCALVAAVTFPSLGFVLYNMLQPKPLPLLTAMGRFVWLTLFSLIGGLHVVALLSSLPFMVKVNQFAGIKLAHLLPVLVVAGGYALDTVNATSREDAWQRIRQRWGKIVGYPVTVGLSVAVLGAMAALVLVLLRTGNEPGVGISAIEMKMRLLLEQYLAARPRTKEFLLGHPALMLALLLSASGVGRVSWIPLLLVGVIGQASIVNTLCHIHTPLALSFSRILIGWLLGAIIGTIIFLLVQVVRRIQPKGWARTVI